MTSVEDTNGHRGLYGRALKLLLSPLAVVTFFLWMTLPAAAQSTTGEITGRVTDATGAIIPNATVTVTQNETSISRTITSNSDGEFTFTFLRAGSYTVQVKAQGFAIFAARRVALSAGVIDRVDAQLQPGDNSQTIEVLASTAIIQSDSDTVGTTVSEKQVQDLPLNGRNYVNLVTIQPGVNAGFPSGILSGTRPDTRRPTASFSANGQGDQLNGNYLDGMDNNERIQGGIGIRPSIEAIAEVRVETQLSPASEGRSAGAIVNVITKAGGNQFHGSVFEYFRNDLFDARSYFARVGVIPKPELRQNQFGGSLGGPIFKDKTFFFGDVEFFRTVAGTTPSTVTVPTAFEQMNPGNFTDILPASVPFTPDPIAAKIFALYPLPNTPGTVVNGVPNSNYTSSFPGIQNAYTADLRLDHHFNVANSVFLRLSYNPTKTTTPGILPPKTVGTQTVYPVGITTGNYPGTDDEKSKGFQLNYLHVFSPRLVLELKTGATAIQILEQTPNQGSNISTAFGIPNINISVNTSGLSSISPAGYAPIGDPIFTPISNINNVFQYLGSATYSRGNHTIKVGGGLIRRQIFYNQNSFGEGRFNTTAAAPNSLITLLHGNLNTLARSNQVVPSYLRTWESNAYIQDDWHVAPKLTLNLGLRWDLFTPFTDAHNNRAFLNAATLVENVGGTAGLLTNYKNFGPRIGFAFSPQPSTVIRGGFGISYYPGIQDPGNGNFPYGSSFSCTVGQPLAQSGCPTQYGTLAQGLPIPALGNLANVSGGQSARLPVSKTPSVQQYNLTVQQKIGANVMTVAYVGEGGRHGTENINYDYNDPTTAATPLPLRFVAQLPNVSSIGLNAQEGNSSHNSLQASFERHLTKGLTFNGNYTWAHGFTNFTNNGGSTNPYSLLPFNDGYDRGNSELDVKNRVAVSVDYDFPYKKTTGLSGLTLGGWQANGIFQYQGGQPFTVVDSAFTTSRINIQAVGTDRPNAIRNANLGSSRSLNQWFDPTAFTLQNRGIPGNEQKNELRGPTLKRADLSVFKSFPLYREARLQFRAECFNLSNTPYFALPGNTINSWLSADNTVTYSGNNVPPTPTPSGLHPSGGTLGRITAVSTGSIPRQFQFALKAVF